MLEWAIIPLTMVGAAMIPKTSNDKKKIQTIFENTGYGIRNKKGDLQHPKFKKRLPIIDGEEEIGTRYLYMIPLGLAANKAHDMEKHVGFFTDGLNRPVIVEFRRVDRNVPGPKYLMISVFNKEIPDLYPYANVPDKDGWLIPLGRTLEETIWHDFDKTPHMTVAGTTRFGKTVFLKVMMTYLIEHHEEDAEFFIIDLKGGLEFLRYKNLSQVKGVARNPAEALVMLQYVHGLLQEDYEYFSSKGWNDVTKTPIKRRRFVIVDEAAQLAPEKWMSTGQKNALGECQWILGEITRIGGGIGYREVFCTQYPTSDTLPRSIKQNSDGKITFRLPSGYASDVAIDEGGAEKLPSDIRGRALYKTHELKEMQVPLLDDKEMWERLSKYESDIEEETTSGGDFIKFGRDEVRNEGTAPTKTQPKNGKKRTKGPRKHEGVSSDTNARREKHILPKRKGSGISRKRDRSEMEPNDRPPSNEE